MALAIVDTLQRTGVRAPHGIGSAIVARATALRERTLTVIEARRIDRLLHLPDGLLVDRPDGLLCGLVCDLVRGSLGLAGGAAEPQADGREHNEHHRFHGYPFLSPKEADRVRPSQDDGIHPRRQHLTGATSYGENERDGAAAEYH
jgi:hypothetical protein